MTEQQEATKPKILIVEDEAIIALDLKSLLEQMGYTVLAFVNSGEKALELTEQEFPDLVLMDIVLAGKMDGIEAADIIRSRWGIPVVFCTAYADRDRLERAKLVYPFGYILKPFQDNDIKVTLEMALYISKVDKERRKAEEALKESEERFRTLYENAPVFINGFDKNGRCILWNKECEKVFGWTINEINSQDEPLALFYPDPEVRKQVIDTVNPSPEKIFREWHSLTRDGKKLTTLWANFQFPDGRIINIGYDITERSLAVENLRKWAYIFEYADLGVGIVGAEGKTLVLMNPAFAGMHGYTVEEFIGRPITEIFAPEYRDKVSEQIWMTDEKTHHIIESKHVRKDGTVFPVQIDVTVVKDKEGRVQFRAVHVQDITERKRTEETLRESEENYRNLFENANEAIFVAQDGKVVFLNPKTVMMSGYSAEELLSRPFTEFIHPDDRDIVMDRHVMRLKGEELPPVYDYQIIHKDGNIRWVELNAVVINWKGGTATLNFLSDITERKGMEEKIRQSEERYRTVIEEIDEGYYEVDLAGNFTFVNDSMTRQLQYSREELIEMNYRTYIPREEVEGVYKTFNRAYRTGKIIKWHPTTNIRKDGTPIFVEDSISIRRDREGRIIGFWGISRDITERKQAEMRLRESEERYRSLASAEDSMYLVDRECRFRFMNQAHLSRFGLSLDEAIGRSYSEFHSEEDSQQFAGIVKEVFETNTSLQVEHKSEREPKYFLRTFSPLRDPQGSVTAVTVISKDITMRRQMEESLRRERNFAEGLINTAQVIILILDLEGRIVRFNPYMEKLSGYSLSEVQGKDWFDTFLPPQDRPKMKLFFLEAVKDIQTKGNVNPILTKDGRIRQIEWYDKTLKDADGNSIGLLAAGQDITERKHAQEALRVSETRYRLLAENARDVIWTVGMDMRLTYVSPSVTRLLGFTEEEAMERTMQQAYTQASFVKAMQIFAEEMAIESAGHGDPARSRMLELDLVRKDGNTVPVEGNFCFLRDSTNNVIGILSILRDISDRNRAEEKIKASHREKEMMLKEIHHRVKNNLAVISSLLGLQSRYLKDEKSREIFQESQDRVRVMANIHTLLYQSEDLSRVDFGGFIRDLAGRLQQSYGTAEFPIEIHVDIADVSLPIETSIPCGLVLNELISNVLKHAFPEGRGGEVHIRLTTAGDWYVLTVQDNGIGFPEAVDFQNTKSLGLELVNLLVGQIKGTIDLTVDGGTKFTITIPMANHKG